MRTWWLGATGLVCGLLGATTAQAATSDSPPADGDAGQQRAYMASTRVGGDLFWHSAERLGSTFALVPSGSFEVTEKIFVDFWAPVALNVGSAGDETYFGLGNPTVGAHYAMTSGPTTFYVGGRLGLPLVQLFDDRHVSTATALAAYAMALYDNYLWVSYLPVGAFGGVEHVVNEIFRVRGELAPTFLIPFEGRDAEFQYQLRGEGEARHESGFAGGLGLQAVHLVTSRGDNAQVAIEPYVGYDNDAIFARLGLLTALDEPLGFGFDSGPLKVATARFRFGVYF